jgi:hypothetical protein
MKSIELSEATSPMANYVQQAIENPLLITVDGMPRVAMLPVEGSDEETVGLSTNPRFIAMLEDSRKSYKQHGGIPLEEVRRRYGIPAGSAIPPVSCDDYRHALDRLKSDITDAQRKILGAHYHAPNRTLTASELATAANLTSYHATNASYGRLGRLIGEWITFPYESDYWVESLATWQRDSDGELTLTMRPELAAALEQLGWV